MIYKNLDGSATTWKGRHVSWWRRIIYSLYKKYVNEPFIPKDTSFRIDGIKSIRMSFKGLNTGRFEDYIFQEFHKIS